MTLRLSLFDLSEANCIGDLTATPTISSISLSYYSQLALLIPLSLVLKAPLIRCLDAVKTAFPGITGDRARRKGVSSPNSHKETALSKAIAIESFLTVLWSILDLPMHRLPYLVAESLHTLEPRLLVALIEHLIGGMGMKHSGLHERLHLEG